MLCELLDTPLEKFHFSVSLHNFISKIRRKKSDWFLNGLLLHLIRLNLSLISFCLFSVNGGDIYVASQ